MIPKSSVLSLARFCQSPLGALLSYALLLGLPVISAFAQTRLDSSQVAPLQGAVSGPFSAAKLRDINSAADHGNGLTNGINSAIADCGTAISCSILVPPSYGTAEAVPGYQLNFAVPPAGATGTGNVRIIDSRYSDARMNVNDLGYSRGLQDTPAGWIYNYYAKAIPASQFYSFLIRQQSLDGGSNQKSAALNYNDKTTWAGTLSSEISHTQAQHLNLAVGSRSLSIGDFTQIKNSVTCYGGFTTEGDQGCRALDNVAAQGNVEYSGTLSGSPTTAATSLTVSPVQGAFTQGAGRFLARMNAGTISTGTIAQYANNSNSVVVTGAGTSWPVSTVVATLGTNVVNPGTVVVTPANFSVGSMAGIQTSQLICVADHESFEMLYPASVTGSTFTANFVKIHPSNAIIGVGGLCGYLMELTADQMTNSTMPLKSQTITGTLHFAWPVVTSASATNAGLWVAGGGGFQPLTSRFNSTTANNYVLYQFAEVTSVQQGGTLSDTLTVSPNNIAWANGDTVSEFLYPAFHATFGNSYAESFYPNMSGGNGFSLQYNMPLQANEAMLSLRNNGPLSFYNSQGGRYDSPTAVHMRGTVSKAITIDSPGSLASIAVGCISPCNSTASVIAAGNSQYYDFLSYDQSARHWNMSANNASVRYSLAANRLDLPFANTYMSNDFNSTGYLSTYQMRSNAVTNSDVAGELVFNNVTSMTQPLLGAYASHPECHVRPQFDFGSTNRFWVSYAAANFTVNFAAPISGTVTYSCTARN